MTSDLVAVATGSSRGAGKGKAPTEPSLLSAAPLHCHTLCFRRAHGTALIGAELAERLGVLDIDGLQPASHRRTLGAPPELHESLRP